VTSQPRSSSRKSSPQPDAATSGTRRGTVAKATTQDVAGGPPGRKPKFVIEDRTNLKSYLPLIEKVAQVEYYRVPNHMVELDELITTGLMAIQMLIQNKTQAQLEKLNTSYLATCARWAIRNELRSRFRWYTMQANWKMQGHDDDESGGASPSALDGTDLGEGGTDDETPVSSGTSVRIAKRPYYENILSIDGIADSGDGDAPYDFIRDPSHHPDERLENIELMKAVKEAIQKLPPKERTIVEYRFYRNMQVKEIASMIGLSSSRITRIVQGAMGMVRDILREAHQIP
jgi:RNA polymerase sigma factor (sigma-70 family)